MIEFRCDNCGVTKSAHYTNPEEWRGISGPDNSVSEYAIYPHHSNDDECITPFWKDACSIRCSLQIIENHSQRREVVDAEFPEVAPLQPAPIAADDDIAYVPVTPIADDDTPF